MGECMKKSKIILLLSVMLLLACLFAVGCAKSFKVTFDGNGGTLVSGKEVQEIKKAEEIEAPVYEKEGYIFANWDKNLGSITEDTTVKAVWEANKYNVTFVLNGGENLEGGNVKEYTYDEEMALPTPTRVGYTFAGWKKGSLEGEALVDGAIFKDTTPFNAVAVWNANTYTITFDINDAENSPATMEGETVRQYVFGDPMELPVPTRAGYIFAGWEKGETILVQGQANNIAENFTAVASWEFGNDIFTIALDLAGGSMKDGEANPTTYKTSDETITLKNPVKAGYRFVGWKALGAEPVKSVVIEAGSNFNVAYTAVWEQITYTIDFVLVGVNDDGRTQQLTIGGQNDIANVTINAEEALGEKLPLASAFDPLTSTQEYAFDDWTVVVGGSSIVIDANYIFTAEIFGEADSTIQVVVALVSVYTGQH